MCIRDRLLTEETLTNKFKIKFEKDFKTPNRANLKSWTKEINKLKKESGEPIVDRMHKRVLFSIFILTYSGENANLSNATKEQSSFIKNIKAIIQG